MILKLINKHLQRIGDEQRFVEYKRENERLIKSLKYWKDTDNIAYFDNI